MSAREDALSILMRTIGLYGGSFNPPHVAHQLAALHALEMHALDELWFVPVFVHPHGKPLAPYSDRVAMCERAAAALGPRVKVSRAEQQLAAPCHTIDLLEHLANPDVQFRLVLGADLVTTAPAWHRWPEVVKRAPLIVVPRGTEGPAATSGTEVRARLARREDVTDLVPAAVREYIASRQLYAPASYRALAP